jgi:hypothetical protein
MCQVRAGERAIRGPQDAPIAQHHFQTAAHAEVIEVRGVPGAFVERVPDNPAFRGARGRIHHEAVAAPAQLVVHLLVGHARLDRGEAQRLVDLQDAIHARADIDDNVSGPDRAPEAVPSVFAGAEAVERDTVLVRNANNRLHLCGRCRIHHARRASVPTRQEIAAVAYDRLFRCIDGAAAERSA